MTVAECLGFFFYNDCDDDDDEMVCVCEHSCARFYIYVEFFFRDNKVYHVSRDIFLYKNLPSEKKYVFIYIRFAKILLLLIGVEKIVHLCWF